jgi:taurine dioxygenase
MTLSITPTSAPLGVEIAGVDLTQPIDGETFAQIRAAFFRHEVAIFRNQPMTDEQHISFSRYFGNLRKLKVKHADKRLPEISVVSNLRDGDRNVGNYEAGMYWHTDGSHHRNPHAISLLRALEVPAPEGDRTFGDTLYASVTAAYDALPESMKKRIEHLQGVHSVRKRYEKAVTAGLNTQKDMVALRAAPVEHTESAHPVVRIHPFTGRKCLYVTDTYTSRILGLPQDESDDLITELSAHCVKPEFQYSHKWQPYDFVMWDDCSTQHRATIDYRLPQRRLMHRTTVINGSDND